MLNVTLAPTLKEVDAFTVPVNVAPARPVTNPLTEAPPPVLPDPTTNPPAISAPAPTSNVDATLAKPVNVMLVPV